MRLQRLMDAAARGSDDRLSLDRGDTVLCVCVCFSPCNLKYLGCFFSHSNGRLTLSPGSGATTRILMLMSSKDSDSDRSESINTSLVIFCLILGERQVD